MDQTDNMREVAGSLRRVAAADVAVYQRSHLQYAVREAIANGIAPGDVLELTRELTESYQEHADPAAVASEDMAGGF